MTNGSAETGRPGSGGQPRESVPLAPRTSLGVGGEARYLWECTGAGEIRRALRFADRRDLPVQLLGEGSNTVFREGGFPGLVVSVGLRGREFEERGQEVELRAAAGEHWDDLVRESVARGLTGIECLSGIPGTAGAAPYQNVGAYGQELAETLVDVGCLDRRTGERVRLGREECGFGYRTSRFKAEDRGRFVILDFRLRLAAGRIPRVRYPELEREVEERGALSGRSPSEAVREVRRAVLDLRERKSMVLREDDPDSRSAGSFFLNPVLSREEYHDLVRRWEGREGREPVPSFPAGDAVKVPAAWLVEHAGFEKGHRHGGVGISRKHALALVNYGGGRADELLELARRIQRAVEEKFGVHLEPEPVIAGEPER